ncbi:hypothetical protein, partial [Caldimonas sp. KR1-144]|uniref:hypothetical protein n=1 Tax=Caldimonas sp. KR1-144 TaxID=3400911 RepID=UPI003C04871F
NGHGLPLPNIDESSHFPSWHFDAGCRFAAAHSGRGSPFHSLGAMNWKLLVVWCAICCCGGALISAFSSMPFWGGAAIVAAALLVNGMVAEVEDRSPGGFLSPRDKQE